MTDFVRHVVRIPVSDEMLFDFGFAGPRFRSIPDRDRWTQAWQESQRSNRPFTFFRSAPPWENWDQPATPNTLTFWPRIEALVARLTAAVKRVKTERRRFRYRLIGARDGFLLRTDDDDRRQ